MWVWFARLVHTLLALLPFPVLSGREHKWPVPLHVCPTETTGEPALQTSLVGGGKRADGVKGQREGGGGERGRGGRRGRKMERAGDVDTKRVKDSERNLEEGEDQSALTIVREG